MAAVDPGDVSYTALADARGDRPLPARMEGGVKVYDLTASVIRWDILPDEQVMAYATCDACAGASPNRRRKANRR